MKILGFFFATFVFLGFSYSAFAQSCEPSQYYSSIKRLPNGTAIIAAPGFYENGVLVNYFSYVESDDNQICNILGFASSRGAFKTVVQEKRSTCLKVGNTGIFGESNECGETYEQIFCL